MVLGCRDRSVDDLGNTAAAWIERRHLHGVGVELPDEFVRHREASDDVAIDTKHGVTNPLFEWDSLVLDAKAGGPEPIPEPAGGGLIDS